MVSGTGQVSEPSLKQVYPLGKLGYAFRLKKGPQPVSPEAVAAELSVFPSCL
jgi:hypothetical protein